MKKFTKKVKGSMLGYALLIIAAVMLAFYALGYVSHMIYDKF